MYNKALFIQKKISKQYFITVLLILFFNLIANAQQSPHYTQYLYNMQIINPAYVGARAELSATLLSRQQWVGVNGAPTTTTFSINGRTRKGLGIGATFVNDKIGLSESNNVNVDVSYTLVMSQYSRLAFGLKGGLTFFNNNLFDAITPDNDVYNSISGKSSNVGFGAFFYNRRFYVGLSVPYLLETPQFYTQENFNKGEINTNLNYYFSTGAIFQLSENIMFKPSTMVRQVSNSPISVDLNSNFLYREVIETGVSYRYQNSISAMFAVILKEKFRIGYAYDHKLTSLGGNFSSHEIIFHIDINLQRNTRWLLHNKCYF